MQCLIDEGLERRAAAAQRWEEKLRKVLRPEEGGLALGSFGEGTRWIPELLRRCWLRPAK